MICGRVLGKCYGQFQFDRVKKIQSQQKSILKMQDIIVSFVCFCYIVVQGVYICTPTVSYVLSRQLVIHWKFCYNSSVVPVQDYMFCYVK